MQIQRITSTNELFMELIQEMDRAMDQKFHEKDDTTRENYETWDTNENIETAVLISDGEKAAACGRLHEFDPDTVEIRQIFVTGEYRRKGLADIILGELELWAMEMGYERVIAAISSGKPEAQELFYKHDYTKIPNYGQYTDMSQSICLEKNLLEW